MGLLSDDSKVYSFMFTKKWEFICIVHTLPTSEIFKKGFLKNKTKNAVIA